MTEPLEAVAGLLQREAGIRLERTHYPALLAAIARAVPDAADGDPLAFLRAASDPIFGGEAVARLVDAVTVKETSFFRDRRQLDPIAWRILLERAREEGSDRIRVWSAACATGEEVYTLALLAREAFPSGDLPVDVLGTDIAASALEAAIGGVYRERSMRAVDSLQRRRFFEPDASGRWSVAGELRQLVRFAPHNLARDPIPPLREERFQLIVCRNVLIYFDGDTVERVIESLERALAPGGMLVLGSADTLCGTVRRLAKLADEPPLQRRPVPPAPKRVSERPALRPVTAPAVAPEPVLDPFDADGWFLRGVSELEGGDPVAAVRSLRRALYVDPSFALASFTSGRAYEALGDVAAARRAYEQALRTIDLEDERHDHLLEQVHLTDVATACRVRLRTLR